MEETKEREWHKTTRKFTLEERKKLQTLIERGHKRKDIADFLKRHPKVLQQEVARCIKKHGSYDAEIAHKMKASKRSGPPSRSLSLDQIALIKEGLDRGLSLCATAAFSRTGRKKVKEYADEHGYTIKTTVLAHRGAIPQDSVSFEQRIIFLEEQVKILSEITKEIMCRK